jgi:hypothetical protein
MKSWRPSRPSPAMIVALLSLCVALGGSALAAKRVVLAPKNSVNSAAVINNSLKLKDFKKAERAKLKGAKGDQGIQGPAGTPDGYTKTDADGKFLGKGDKAADADKLDGINSSELTQGSGSQTAVFRNLNDGQKTGVGLPGMGTFSFDCDTTMSYGLDVNSDVTDHVLWETSDNGGVPVAHDTPAGAGYSSVISSANHVIIAQFHRAHSPLIGSVDQNNATVVMTVIRGASDCRVHMQLINSHDVTNLLL